MYIVKEEETAVSIPVMWWEGKVLESHTLSLSGPCGWSSVNDVVRWEDKEDVQA